MIRPQASQDAAPRHALACRRVGFTLIELLAVIIILALVAMVAAPSLVGAAEARVRAGAQQMARDLAYARGRAQTTGIAVWVRFTPAQSMYTVLAEAGVGAGRASALTITDPGTGGPMVVRLNREESRGATFTISGMTGDEVGFDRGGRALNPDTSVLASNATITFPSGATVTITGRTGNITAVTP
jgi:prepilin-type N-terminal cleavage/methylation domain-containing protein